MENATNYLHNDCKWLHRNANNRLYTFYKHYSNCASFKPIKHIYTTEYK